MALSAALGGKMPFCCAATTATSDAVVAVYPESEAYLFTDPVHRKSLLEEDLDCAPRATRTAALGGGGSKLKIELSAYET